jgi:predicted DNA-binding transcriptional regulator YafY
MPEKPGHRDKMRDECVRMQEALRAHKRIRMQDLADETGISLRTAYRWVGSFSMVMPIEVRQGMVIIGDDIL